MCIRDSANTIVMLFILPMWVNILVRTLATVALFDFADLQLGEGALLFGMVYNFIPFMIYPIYNTLQKMDRSYIEAAEDLGASPWQQFYKVILPLSMPGVASGILMVFMPTISTFAISELLTMNNIKLFGTTIQENINNSMWNYGCLLYTSPPSSLSSPISRTANCARRCIWQASTVPTEPILISTPSLS